MEPISTAPQPVTLQRPRTVLTTLAEIVSYIFHPVFMPIAVAATLYYLMPAHFANVTLPMFKNWLLIIAMLTVFFPLLSVGLMKALGFVQSIHMRTSRDRVIPLIATMTFYFWANHVFGNFSQAGEVPPMLKSLMLGTFWGVIVLFMMSIFFKISMHTSAAGSVVALFGVALFISSSNMLPAFLGVVFIAGLIGSARLILREHTPAEVWMGYIFGFLVQLAAYWYTVA